MAPKLYMISRPSLDLEEVIRFLKDEAVGWERSHEARPGEELVELGGRVCYMSFGEAQYTKPTSAYVANLIRRGHESVLEHAYWTFILTGVSRAFSHQLVRHRVGFSYSQLSQQYHEETDPRFALPSAIRGQPKLEALWRDCVAGTHSAYNQILRHLEDLEAREDAEEGREHLRELRSAARSVLPNATETKICVTANARALRHFLKLRGALIGDEEMRAVSSLILESVRRDAPSLFQDFTIGSLRDSSTVVRHEPLNEAG